MPSPFLERQPADPHAELEFCTACGSFFWTDLPHGCDTDPLGVSRGVFVGLLIAIALWLCVFAGWVPWREGWFS